MCATWDSELKVEIYIVIYLWCNPYHVISVSVSYSFMSRLSTEIFFLSLEYISERTIKLY